jgi:hypothetical protein
MGLGYVFGATPAVQSASLCLTNFNFLDGAPIQAASSNLELLTLLRFSPKFFSIFSPFMK